MAARMDVIWGRDQPDDLRLDGPTCKSPALRYRATMDAGPKVACDAAQRSKQGQGTNEMGVSCLARSIFNTELASDGER